MSTPRSDPVIRVDAFSFRYPGSDEFVLEEASLDVAAGEFLAVLGGNGSGKTTLCKSFNGLVPHFFEGETGGRVVVDGRETAAESTGTLSSIVGYVYQDFDHQLVQPTVRQDVEFGPLNYGYEDYADRATRALERLDIGHLADDLIWELSGGQKHLVALAGVLALEPAVVVVDEPAAQLDPQNALAVYETLAAINRDGQTVVTIEHDTELVADYADRVALVDDGQIRWTAPTRTALNRIEELRERDIHPPQVTELCRRIEATVDDAPADVYPVTVAAAADATAGRQPTVSDGRGEAPSAPATDPEPVVTFDGVDYGYLADGDPVTILSDFSLSIRSGENVALVGANGAGKSTVLKLITGLLTPDSGSVAVRGTDTAGASPEELAEEVVYVHQQPEEMFVEDTVEKDVSYYLRQRDRGDVAAVVDEVLETLDLDHLRAADGRLLSVGQQRRASLAIGLAMEPSVVLLDEPTGCLDVASRREVATMLDRVDSRVEAVVVATHDMQFVASWADRVVVLADGTVEADAPPAAALADQSVLDGSALRPPQPVELSRELGIEPPATTVDELAGYLGDGP